MANVSRGDSDAASARRVSLNPKVHEHIPPRYLPNLTKYKYSGFDSSIVSRYVMQPYWNFIVNLVPMTVSPNTITLIGFFIGVSSTLLVLFYYFFCEAIYPTWVWYYAAAALFTYQTLDAIDGKQARRTQTIGPLGELFDHGCDAFLTPLAQLNICCAMQLTSAQTFVYCTLSSCVLFGAIWEQFSTGTLDLGYVNGPTEGILSACVVFFLTGFYSPSIWDLAVVGPYEISFPFVGGSFVISTTRSLLLFFFVCCGTLTFMTNVAHVLMRPSLQARGVSLLVALPYLFLVCLHIVLYFTYTHIHGKYPFAFELSLGFLTSYTVTRMTVARLCKMPYSLFNAFYLITFFFTLGALITHAYFPFIEEKYLVPSLGSALVSLAALGVWQYLHMALSLITQIAYFLDIPVLTINTKANNLNNTQ